MDEDMPVRSVQRDDRSARLLTRGAAYTVATAGPKAVQLMTLPLLALAMSPAEFGRMALAVAVSLAIVPLLTRSLETAVFRSWYVLADDEIERRRYLSTAAFAVLAVTNALALLAVVLALPYTAASSTLPTSYLALALFGSAMVISVSVIPLGVLRAQDRLRAFLRVSLIGPITSTPLMIIAVVGLDMGARGWLLANLIGAFITLPFATLALREQWTSRLSRKHLRDLVAWAVPFIPHGVAHWTLATSDRMILASFVSITQLGVYNIGYQLAMGLSLLYTALNNVVSSNYGRAIGDAVQRARLSRLVSYQVLVTVGLGLFVALLTPPAMALLLPPEFDAAQEVVPWVALGYVFFGLYLVPMNIIVILGGDTKLVWLPTSIAAVTNVSLNLLLVPSGGIVAAAINTAASYLVMLVTMSLYGCRYHPLPGGVAWRKLLLALGAAAAVYAFAVAMSPEDSARALVWRSACLVPCGVGGFWYAMRVAKAASAGPRSRAATEPRQTHGKDW